MEIYGGKKEEYELTAVDVKYKLCFNKLSQKNLLAGNQLWYDMAKDNAL